jgi:hypothetical protein
VASRGQRTGARGEGQGGRVLAPRGEDERFIERREQRRRRLGFMAINGDVTREKSGRGKETGVRSMPPLRKDAERGNGLIAAVGLLAARVAGRARRSRTSVASGSVATRVGVGLLLGRSWRGWVQGAGAGSASGLGARVARTVAASQGDVGEGGSAGLMRALAERSEGEQGEERENKGREREGRRGGCGCLQEAGARMQLG